MKTPVWNYNPMDSYSFWITCAGHALRDKNNLFEWAGTSNFDYALERALTAWMEAQ